MSSAKARKTRKTRASLAPKPETAPEPQPITLGEAKRNLRFNLGRWRSIVRWMEFLESDKSPDPDGDSNASVFAQADVREAVVASIREAARVEDDAPAVVLLDGQILVAIPRCDGNTHDHTYSAEMDGFLVIPQESWMYLEDIKDGD